MLSHAFIWKDSDTVIIPYSDKSALYVVSFILSGIGVSYIILTLFALKLLANPLSRMVLFISLCDLLLTGGVVILYSIDKPNEKICDSFVWVTHYAILASFSWAACFTHAFMTVVKNVEDKQVAANLKYYIAISHIVPIPLTILAIKTDFVRYDQENNYCYHEFTYGKLDVSFFWTEIVPYTIALAFSLYFSISSLRKLIAVSYGKNKWNFLSILQFPLILIICWFGQQLNIFLAQFNIRLSDADNIAVVFQTLCFLQGFFNAIAYGMTYTVFKGYKKLYKKLCKKKFFETESSMDHVVFSSDDEFYHKSVQKNKNSKKPTCNSVPFESPSAFSPTLLHEGLST